MKSHSYREAHYKCEECDFVGESEITMEVHLGKVHSDKYECGLCDFEAMTLENLELHLFSCEVYKCNYCEKKFKCIKDVKDHIEEMKYSGGYEFIIHLKMDRNSPNEVSDKSYRSDKIKE